MHRRIFSNISNNKKLIFRLFLIYLAVAAAIYSFFIINTRIQTSRNLNNEMDIILKNFKTQAELTSRVNSIDAKNLALMNTIRVPLITRVFSQVKSECDNFLKDAYSNLKNVAVVDSDGIIVYSNCSVFKENTTSGAKTSNNAYVDYYSDKESIYILYYYPVFSGQQFCGALLYAADIKEFSQLMLASISGTPYDIYGISGDRIVFISSGGNIKKVNYVLKSSVNEAVKFKAVSLIIGKDSSKLVIESLDTVTGNGNTVLSLGISKEEYAKLEAYGVKKAVINGTGVLLLCIAVTLVVFLIMKSYIYRNVKMKLQIENLRIQKHDFLKHINVINGLISCNEIDSLKKYIDELGTSLTLKNEISKIGKTAVGVLIQQKEKTARECRIPLTLICNTSLQEFAVDDSDLCAIIGNLLDNAIEASQEIPDGNRKIQMEITSESDFLIIRVFNKGNPIKGKDMNKIFKLGYTTKPDKDNHGMGLYIITEILKKYDGSIEVENKDDGVMFAVYIP